jgi:hypothetical protein
MAATDRSEVSNSGVIPDLERYEMASDSYGLKLTNLNRENLIQNRTDKTGYIERTFFGLTNGALYANNLNDIDPQRYCTAKSAYQANSCSN